MMGDNKTYISRRSTGHINTDGIVTVDKIISYDLIASPVFDFDENIYINLLNEEIRINRDKIIDELLKDGK